MAHDPPLRAAMAELLARAMTMGDADRYIILAVDPEIVSSPLSSDSGLSAVGPLPGAQALAHLERMRADLDSGDAGNVLLLLVPCEEAT